MSCWEDFRRIREARALSCTPFMCRACKLPVTRRPPANSFLPSMRSLCPACTTCRSIYRITGVGQLVQYTREVLLKQEFTSTPSPLRALSSHHVHLHPPTHTPHTPPRTLPRCVAQSSPFTRARVGARAKCTSPSTIKPAVTTCGVREDVRRARDIMRPTSTPSMRPDTRSSRTV
ncbi:hypothetical protein E2C01_014825 [Portunus trituberculatus]|uniref:Uncharacterized protein n=1 Tax=Portunus trituberculatus TaxID=210409 RepID=A0A5B7DKZ3_PORTR|nr:hypothetical protein [Portunus trituberculatus]